MHIYIQEKNLSMGNAKTEKRWIFTVSHRRRLAKETSVTPQHCTKSPLNKHYLQSCQEHQQGASCNVHGFSIHFLQSGTKRSFPSRYRDPWNKGRTGSTMKQPPPNAVRTVLRSLYGTEAANPFPGSLVQKTLPDTSLSLPAGRIAHFHIIQIDGFPPPLKSPLVYI